LNRLCAKQGPCDLFYEGEFVVTVGNRKSAETKAAAPAPKPNQPPTAKVGTETDATPHGFYAKLTKETEFGTPWHVFQRRKQVAFGVRQEQAGWPPKSSLAARPAAGRHVRPAKSEHQCRHPG
jgi:hypothetical protein